jgi:D-alanyl-lipoteichoic acid acyltransferase DltB (MBOAT superfamily)
MLFPTIEFGAFFAFVLPLAWALNERNGAKKLFLLLCSYVFYGCWRVEFVPLLFASSCVNFIIGLALARAPQVWRKPVLVCGVAFDLGLLAYFKYFNFLSAEIGALAESFGVTIDLGETGVALPMAISFVTFHGLSYIIDVYRGATAASTRLVDVLLYIAFFPHLVAGPIVRAADFLDQLSKPSDPRRIALGASVIAILGGLFKKVVVAGHLSTGFVDPVFAAPAAHGRLDLVLAVYAYAIVIYCDFSAYTDMARGLAALLGYRFPDNFDRPYGATSLQDFWRRWHITLSSWLRDYLYVPLGGSRGGAVATGRNLVITMTLGGLWHGAGLQFILWGALHGAGLALERVLHAALPPRASAGAACLRWLVTFHFVCLGWVLFRSPSLADSIDYFRALAGDSGAPTTVTPFLLALMALGLAPQFLPRGGPAALARAYDRITLPAQIAAPIGLILVASALAPAGVAPFIYFQF